MSHVLSTTSKTVKMLLFTDQNRQRQTNISYHSLLLNLFQLILQMNRSNLVNERLPKSNYKRLRAKG